MKKIIDTETAFNNYKKYIEGKEYLPIVKKKLEEFAKNCKINLADFIDEAVQPEPNLFTLSPQRIKELVEILNNSEYKDILAEAGEYKKLSNNAKKAAITERIAAFKELYDYFQGLYLNFSRKDYGYAYEMIKDMGLRACPYCNLNYVDAVIKEDNKSSDDNDDSNDNEHIKTEDKIVRPHLDHFYPKSKYPFFAISFYNLIPSCYECNSGLKGDDILTINPYIDDFDSMAVFDVIFSGEEDNIKNFRDTNTFDIILNPLDKETDVENYISILRLNERYYYRKDVASELLIKTNEKTKFRFDELRCTLCLQGYTDDEVDLIIYGNYIKNEDIHKRPLAKLTKDIVKRPKAHKS